MRAKTSAWQLTQRYCHDDFLLTNNFKKKSFCIGTYAHKTKKSGRHEIYSKETHSVLDDSSICYLRYTKKVNL